MEKEKSLFMDVEEKFYLKSENEEMVRIKVYKNSESNVNIVYNKERDETYVCYRSKAILKLNARVASEALAELEERATEFLAELTTLNTYIIMEAENQKQQKK